MRLVVLLAVALITTPAAPAGAGVTHLLQARQNHVTLAWKTSGGSCPTGGGFFKVLPGGATVEEEYRVPAGRVLVLTDVMFTVGPYPTSFAAGRQMHFAVEAWREVTFLRSPILADPVPITTSNQDDWLGGSVHLTSGARFGSRLKVCASAASQTQSAFAVNSPMEVILEGYTIR